MSSPPKKKPDQNKSSVFDIATNPFEDGAIPGVTDLLMPKARPKNAPLPKTLEPTFTGQVSTTLPAAKKVSSTEATSTSVTESIGAPIGLAPEASDKTNLVEASTLSLRKLGVLFELKFVAEGKIFRFSTAAGHLEEKILPWQDDLYRSMKIDLDALAVQKPFQEFTASSNAFIFDAFAALPQHFIQIITPEFSNSRVVLISKNSLQAKKTELVDHFNKG